MTRERLLRELAWLEPAAAREPALRPARQRAREALLKSEKLPTYHVTLGKHGARVQAPTRGDARDAALRLWFGDGVFWDMEDGRGRPVRQVPVKRRGKVRFAEKPLAPWGKLVIREVR